MDNSPERREARAAYGAGVTAIHNIILQRNKLRAELERIAASDPTHHQFAVLVINAARDAMEECA